MLKSYLPVLVKINGPFFDKPLIKKFLSDDDMGDGHGKGGIGPWFDWDPLIRLCSSQRITRLNVDDLGSGGFLTTQPTPLSKPPSNRRGRFKKIRAEREYVVGLIEIIGAGIKMTIRHPVPRLFGLPVQAVP